MRRAFAIAIAIAVAASAVGAAPPAADAQAVGKRCRPVKAGAYRATHVFADYMSCRSARIKLRRWLRRGQLPKKSNG